MKSKMLIFAPAVSIVAALAAAQSTPAYQVVDLGPVGTPFADVTSINNAGLAAGVATAPNGTRKTFNAKVRIDTPQEIEYFEHGGILQYVLRQML